MKLIAVMLTTEEHTGGKISERLLLEGLKERGHEVIIASPEDDDRFRTIDLDFENHHLLPLRDRQVASEVDAMLDEHDADYLYTSGHATVPGTIRGVRGHDIETVCHYRDYWFACVNGTFIAEDSTYHKTCTLQESISHNSTKRLPWLLYKHYYLGRLSKLLPEVDHSIATSTSVASYLEEICVDADIVPNPVRIDQYEGLRSENDTFTAGFIGRLEPMKGTDLIVDLIERHPSTRFEIAGTGSAEERMREAVGHRDNVTFRGWVDREDVGAFYRSLDVTLYPSLVPEGFGRVAVESMAAGTPVLASDRGGLQDIVRDGTDGHLLDPEDIDAWSSALEHLQDDTSTHGRMTDAARDRAQEFTLKKHVDKFLDTIR